MTAGSRPPILAAGDPTALERCQATLRDGGIVVVPTDTVYGVAAALEQPAAIARLYFAKQRPEDKPIPLLLAGPADLRRIARDVPAGADRLLARCTPGGLTLVVPAREGLPVELTGGRTTVALRLPEHAWLRRLIRETGGALPTTSANLSGEPPATTAEEAASALGDRVELIIDGGACPGGIASTVVEVTGKRPVILRAGAVPEADVLAAWDDR